MAIKAVAVGKTDRPELRRTHKEYQRLLGMGEQLLAFFQVGRDTLLFTNRRLVLIERGVSGRKVDYSSLPYRSITFFSVEASGEFGADADLKIWVAGRTAPLEKQFPPDVDIYEVQALLTQFLG